ncbi:MAG: aspartyl protease family protein [Candidatus Tectomicrobia bacterium]|nr:aspartyl protease family protein [Candidatus Tectomicrobia bacterium]
MGRFSVELKLTNYRDIVEAGVGIRSFNQIRQVTIRGVVDTGATRLVIPASVVEQLGVAEAGMTQVRYADGRVAIRSLVDDVQVELLGRSATFRAAVEPARTSALIGAIVLEELDFIVDCASQALRPRDPNQIISEIE